VIYSGLVHLNELASLSSLNLTGTQVTVGEKDKLSQAHPRLMVLG